MDTHTNICTHIHIQTNILLMMAEGSPSPNNSFVGIKRPCFCDFKVTHLKKYSASPRILLPHLGIIVKSILGPGSPINMYSTNVIDYFPLKIPILGSGSMKRGKNVHAYTESQNLVSILCREIRCRKATTLTNVVKALPVLAHHLVAELSACDIEMLSEGGKFSLRRKKDCKQNKGHGGREQNDTEVDITMC